MARVRPCDNFIVIGWFGGLRRLRKAWPSFQDKIMHIIISFCNGKNESIKKDLYAQKN